MTEKRKCLDCGELLSGRTDKKFCSDLCRNNYNNKLNADSTNYVRNVNNILRRNRRVIEELAPEDKAKVHKNKMLEKGFDFTYFTNIHHTKNNTTYQYCYEYGYMPIQGDFYLIVKRGEK